MSETNINSKYFCSLPFTTMTQDDSGLTGPCCNNSGAFNLKEISIDKRWNHFLMKTLREKHLNGEKPAECMRCYNEEKDGLESLRQTTLALDQNATLHSLVQKNYELGPEKIILFLSNQCNFACRTCQSMNSSQFLDEGLFYSKKYELHESIYSNHPFKKEITENEMTLAYRSCHNLKKIEFYGGEPLLNTTHYFLLNLLVEENKSKDIELYYCTNASIPAPQELVQLWKKFKAITINISLDGIQDSYQYIRWPGQWGRLEKNVQSYKNLQLDLLNTEVKLSCNITVSILNIFYLAQILDWVYQNIGQAKFVTLVHDPSYYCIQNIPDQLKKEITNRLTQSTDHNIFSVLSFMNAKSFDSNAWKNFCIWTERKDHYRLQSIEKSLPDFYQLIKELYQQEIYGLRFYKKDLEPAPANKDFDFKTKKNFCISPWMHMSVNTNGDVYPCRFSSLAKPIGNIAETSFKSLSNSQEMKFIRKEMLLNLPSANCKKCREIEKNSLPSLRSFFNSSFQSHFEKALQTEPTGYLENFKMAYLDIQFSNFCRMKCRTCGLGLSSGWYQDHLALNPHSEAKETLRFTENPTKFWAENPDLLNHVEEIIFDGGEPLEAQEHWDLLNKLVSQQKTDVRLKYITQFQSLNFNSQNIFELWKNFKNINLKISFDASESQAEYLRKGLNWSQLIENIRLIKTEAPHVKFQLNCTVSNINLKYITSLHKKCVELNLINWNQFNLSLLQEPNYYRAHNLPDSFKAQITDSFQSHILYLKKEQLFKDDSAIVQQFEKVLRFMNSEKLIQQDWLQFNLQTDRLDKLRNEKFNDVFFNRTDIFE